MVILLLEVGWWFTWPQQAQHRSASTVHRVLGTKSISTGQENTCRDRVNLNTHCYIWYEYMCTVCTSVSTSLQSRDLFQNGLFVASCQQNKIREIRKKIALSAKGCRHCILGQLYYSAYCGELATSLVTV
jgi:hypothetical protein